ncbi:MAG: hypothetical protein E7563_01455 [Ruminococcaceae bacterium]|nr:hypothetical protein [Oscillospiraceae bacterium]
MLSGINGQSLDAKGRVIISPEYRAELGESFYITLGFNDKPSVQVLSVSHFENLRDQIRNMTGDMANDFMHIYVAPATLVTPNAQGRIQIPKTIRDLANLEKEVMVVGLDNRVEIWDKPTYEEYMKERMSTSYKAGLELLKLF